MVAERLGSPMISIFLVGVLSVRFNVSIGDGLHYTKVVVRRTETLCQADRKFA